MDSDAPATGKPPVKADAGRAAKTLEEGDKDAKNGDWRMDGDEVRFFPFREWRTARAKKIAFLKVSWLLIGKSLRGTVAHDFVFCSAKIRRLYDVANVLVSVGLIEKLQLSNSRKPVFRWKTRNTASASELKLGESEGKPSEPLADSSAYVKSETMSPGAEMEDTDAMKSPQSCDSDMFDDGSDSQSDASSCGSKRKQNDQEGSDVSMSDGESSTKRSRRIERKLSMEQHSAQATGERKIGLLRMDNNNEPIHPQTILCEQQEQVKLYMQQYIREYVDYLAAHQKLSNGIEGSAGLKTPSVSKSNAVLAKDTHGTPVSLPSLAGSIQDLLLSESPQSVADIVAARVLSNPRPPLASSPEPEAEAVPRPLILSSSSKKQVVFAAKAPSSASSAKPSKEEEEKQPLQESADSITMRKPSQRNSTRDREKAELKALRSLTHDLEAHSAALSRGEMRSLQTLQSRHADKSTWRQERARRAAEETNRALNDQVQSNADWIQCRWELLHEKRRTSSSSGFVRMRALQKKAEDDLLLEQLQQQAQTAVMQLPDIFKKHGMGVLNNSLQGDEGGLLSDMWTHEETGISEFTLLCVRRVPFHVYSTSAAIWTAYHIQNAVLRLPVAPEQLLTTLP
ncbi:unnamed protein product [Phytophthora lilii]|uniref:Unnamed protein product n=1 Tax=Phytophthora lilii TaxID=2077276 RepID=A0A9W6X2C6_9STRA|nr:unnamed protein product [Phytophthora lilii]